MSETKTLGRFGHHPDPAIDFCVEVEHIDSEWTNIRRGFVNATPNETELRERVDKAMQFEVGGELNADAAKSLLRRIEAEMTRSLMRGPDAEMTPPADDLIESVCSEPVKANVTVSDAEVGRQGTVPFGRLTWHESGDGGMFAVTSDGTYRVQAVGFEWEATYGNEKLGRYPAGQVDSARREAESHYRRCFPTAAVPVDEDSSDGRPRYTSKRLRDEIAKAKRYALEEAAVWHVEQAVSMMNVSKTKMAEANGISAVCVERHNWHMESAAAIRALASRIAGEGR